jgi:4-amino-4-deoxy-L-arabinose transferase-like glycosyltransferase
MSGLIGLISIFFIILITMLAAVRWPSISKILYVALTLRLILLLSGHYLITLPDSNSDSIRFELNAWILASDGFFNVLNNYKGPDSYFISWLIAIPYSLFGRSLLMAQSISLFFGIISIVLAWKLAQILWNNDAARKTAWLVALFPSMVLYSVLILREIYICFFLLLAVYGVVVWTKTYNFKPLIVVIIGFVGATFFHGAMILGAILFAIIFSIIILIELYKLILRFKVNNKILIYTMITIIIFFTLTSNIISVPKIGNLTNLTKIQIILNNLNKAYRGDASLPTWTKINFINELFHKGIVKSVYFIYSPFPWDIKKISHTIGAIDGLLYFFLSYLIIKNIKIIWRDPALRIIMIILVFYIFIFGISMGNFGTGIRHRVKFAILFILLAAPFLPNIFLFKKAKFRKSDKHFNIKKKNNKYF